MSVGDTGPFHDLPDGATVYVEIGVDMDWAQRHEPVVAAAVEEFERCGRRPKFGPGLEESPDEAFGAQRPPGRAEVMMSVKMFDTDACTCPACGTTLEAATAIPGQGAGSAPEPGDLAVLRLRRAPAVREGA